MAALKKVINEASGLVEGAFQKSSLLSFVIDEVAGLSEQGLGLKAGVPMATKTVDFTLEVLAPPDWFLSIIPVAGRVVKGAMASFDVMASAVGGFAGSLSLSILGLPAGVAATITPPVITPGMTATVTIPTADLPITVPPPAGTGPIPLKLQGVSA